MAETINGTILYPNGDPHANGTVTFQLVSGAAGGSNGSALIVSTREVKLSATGTFSEEFDANDTIEPAGTYYAVTVRDAQPPVLRYIQITDGDGPFDVDDPDIQLSAPTPPTLYPVPSAGAAGTVLQTDGSSASWAALADEDVTVDPTDVPNHAGALSWSGDQTLETVLAAYDGTIIAAFADISAEVVNRTSADAAEAAAREAADTALAADDTTNAAEAQVALWAATDPGTAPYFELCNTYGGTHGARAWTTPMPGSFTDGLYATSRLSIEEPPGSPPTDGSDFYPELLTQMFDAAGTGAVDILEWAPRFLWENGRWTVHPFIEGVEVGSSVETFRHGGTSILGGTITQTDVLSLPLGARIQLAVTFEFDRGDGKWRSRHWLRTYGETYDAVFDDARWLLLSEAIGASTASIKTDGTEPLMTGAGEGRLHVEWLRLHELGDLFVDGTPGTLLADPSAADAIAADADGVSAFDDGEGNTWTPNASAVAVDPTASSSTSDYPWPHAHCILPVVQKPNSYTGWTPTTSAVQGSGYAAGADSDSEEWTYTLPCKAGTWSLDLLSRKSTSGPIVTVEFDGSAVGTVDTYNGSSLGDRRDTVGSVEIAEDGTYDLVLSNPTRNASNVTGWAWTLQAIDFRRTS